MLANVSAPQLLNQTAMGHAPIQTRASNTVVLVAISVKLIKIAKMALVPAKLEKNCATINASTPKAAMNKYTTCSLPLCGRLFLSRANFLVSFPKIQSMPCRSFQL